VKIQFRPDPKPEKAIKKKACALKRTPSKNKRKPTGELAVFKEIAEERDHQCEVQDCGTWIAKLSPENFHHDKTKGSHPELKLDKTNIKIVCFDCHYTIHNIKKLKFTA
jgi:hypothetical protein